MRRTFEYKGKAVEIEQTLKRAEVFLGLDDSDLSKIAALPSCQKEAYKPEEIVFRGGNEAKYLYILEVGQIDLVMKVPPKARQAPSQVIVDRITKGGLFGWSALVKPHVYVMSAICKEAAVIVRISGAELTALFDSDQNIGYKVFQSLSHIIGARLRDVERVLATGKRWPFLVKQTDL
ncbi:cyclic nucleotide-binding domain-containing protein [Chloroflexota bacterium]